MTQFPKYSIFEGLNDFFFVFFSMASENWLKFFEVKRFNVVSYLMAMKANGYSIVGAEQTAFGGELHKSILPKRMVLVLGYVFHLIS